MSKTRILVLCQGLTVLTLVAWGLKSRGHRVTVAQEIREVSEALARETFDFAVFKWSPALEAAAVLQKLSPVTKFVVLCQSPELPAVNLWPRLAALIFLPCRTIDLWRRINGCLERLAEVRAWQKAEAQLHPVNHRVYRKLAAIFQEMTTSVFSLANHMDRLQHRARDIGDQEVAELCDQASHRNQVLWQIMQEMRDSLSRMAPSTKSARPSSPGPEPVGPYRLR